MIVSTKVRPLKSSRNSKTLPKVPDLEIIKKKVQIRKIRVITLL